MPQQRAIWANIAPFAQDGPLGPDRTALTDYSRRRDTPD